MITLGSDRFARIAFAALAFIYAVRAAAAAQGASPASPPAMAAASPCPEVEVKLTGTIDTKNVKAGDIFSFTTLGQVAYDGAAIPVGTNGVGLVATLDHSKSQGHSGYLVLEARYLERADGSHLPATFTPGGDGRSAAFVRAGSSDAGLIGYLPYYIGSAAGIYNTFHHGKDAAVVAGTHLRLVVGDAFYAGACRLEIDQR